MNSIRSDTTGKWSRRRSRERRVHQPHHPARQAGRRQVHHSQRPCRHRIHQGGLDHNQAASFQRGERLRLLVRRRRDIRLLQGGHGRSSRVPDGSWTLAVRRRHQGHQRRRRHRDDPRSRRIFGDRGSYQGPVRHLHGPSGRYSHDAAAHARRRPKGDRTKGA